jgi:ATP-binding cassette, subfamily F, member 3
MVSIENLTVRFGGATLFDSITIMINDKERLGLVGKNGAGKTTLLRIIAGMQEPTAGRVIRTSGQTAGYLPQQMVHRDGKTVYEETLSAFQDILNLEKEIHYIGEALAIREDYESAEYSRLIERLNQANDELLIHGGKSIHADVEKTLTGLGFKVEDLSRPTTEFSGGWRMRIELAKLLLQKPDFLLLDEPTNHLDIESIEWLESFLFDYNGGIILISHDRVFLDSITKRTVELRLGKAYDYRVPYSRYVELKEERMEQQMNAYQNQRKMIKDTEKFIGRFRYKASKAVQVQSRIKQLGKVQRIEVEEEESGFLNLTFPPSPRSGTIVVEAQNLSKKYGKYTVLDHIDILIERGEKVAFVGRNGEGKTTLAKIIMSQLDYTGDLRIGQNVAIGYFAQNQDELLDGDMTILETVNSVAVGDVRAKIREILGAFLFSGDDTDKKVKVLSGGERSRLSMALMLLQPFNLLVLDEPTNHLDMRSKDILKNALLEFDGTLIVVSHDREFLDGLVDKVYEFKNKKLKEHLGGIFEFLEKKKMDNLRELERNASLNTKKIEDRKAGTGQDNKQTYLNKKEQDKKIRKAKNELDQAEKEILNLEKRIAELEELMTRPEILSGGHVFKEYNESKLKHDQLLVLWEKLHNNYENILEQKIV